MAGDEVNVDWEEEEEDSFCDEPEGAGRHVAKGIAENPNQVRQVVTEQIELQDDHQRWWRFCPSGWERLVDR